MESGVTHDEQNHRFERTEDGKLAFANYRIAGGTLVITHVEADPALRGKGAAGRLMDGMLKEVRALGMKVRPVCGYAVVYMQRHPETHDLLA
jgi:uncharacterized protein